MNSEDCKIVLTTTAPTEIDSILEKVALFRTQLNQAKAFNHELQCEDYDTVYVTSDIHADFLKFVQILTKNKLIDFKGDIYKTNQVEFSKIITDVKWTGGQKTLLLILGDIVDGKRRRSDDPEGSFEVNDPEGSFELLIHVLIHNIRISARSQQSDVLFTLGNHDFDGILINNTSFCEAYVHDSAVKFFGSFENRRNALLPFYKNSPYFFITLENTKNKTEFVFVHASIHKDPGKQNKERNLIDSLKEFQKRLSLTQDFDVIKDQAHVGWFFEMIKHIVWNREYSKKSCPLEEKGPVVIVGHCITSSLNLIDDFEDYSKCDHVGSVVNEEKNGCVSIKCRFHTDNYPHVILVDTASSQAFYETKNETRNVEILKLSHDDQQLLKSRYYKIERLLNGSVVKQKKDPNDVPTLEDINASRRPNVNAEDAKDARMAHTTQYDQFLIPRPGGQMRRTKKRKSSTRRRKTALRWRRRL
jgi:hypothetical protein